MIHFINRLFFHGLFAVLLATFSVRTFAESKASAGEFSIQSTVPLTDAQLQRLRKLVVENREAEILFNKLAAKAKPLLHQDPTPLKIIHYEGLINTDPRRIATVSRLRQMSDAAVLVRYWQASGDPEAAETLKKWITAWASTYVPTGNDVNENKFYPLFVAYLALRDDFSEAERKKVDEWIERMGEKHAKAVSTSTHWTNRYTKSVRMVALFSRILNREDWRKLAVNGLKTYVSRSLRPDGSSLDFERRDTLTYHTSGLRPVVGLAMISDAGDVSLYQWESPSGASIKKSIDFVVPYAKGTKQHREWVNTTVELDRKRAAAGIEKYRTGRLYEPEDSLTLLEEASYFDAGLFPLVRKLYGSDAETFASWTMVVNAAVQAADAEKKDPRD